MIKLKRNLYNLDYNSNYLVNLKFTKQAYSSLDKPLLNIRINKKTDRLYNN